MNPYTLATLLFSLGLGTTTAFASYHWLLAWMGLEINTLAILPLMAQHHHPRAVEATTKYFLTQAVAAAMILFASLTNAWITGQWLMQDMSEPFPTTLILVALSLKIGLAPLHSWMPEVLQGLDLTTGLILSTWQKLAPLALLIQVYPTSPALMTFFGLSSTLVGGWGGLNQTQLRKLLAYSSIAHMGWMVLIFQFSPPLTTLTLFMYIFMTSSTFMIFKINNALSINTLSTSWSKAPVLTAMAPIVLLSLAGLPPLTGFMPKWLILQELTKQGLPFLATITALSALLSLYFYTRLSYTMTLTISPNNFSGPTTWRLKLNYTTLPLAIAITLATLLLPLTPGISSLFSP
uniref:NADH-ubiquinone oxidoreductase chain 2 n=1 Tax=Samaris cristatus TaxID=366934 RepID=A0A0A6Z576_9PLEU|nr:NADH dehydrogenase subunit 2 [Samaris cristatus]AFE62082.1 NADH dehydrogenase subunit 2 [Samaris cristatus]